MLESVQDTMMRDTSVEAGKVIVVEGEAVWFVFEEKMKISESCVEVEAVKMIGIDNVADCQKCMTEGFEDRTSGGFGKTDNGACVRKLFFAFRKLCRA